MRITLQSKLAEVLQIVVPNLNINSTSLETKLMALGGLSQAVTVLSSILEV
jgi:hypothetical protein